MEIPPSPDPPSVPLNLLYVGTNLETPRRRIRRHYAQLLVGMLVIQPGCRDDLPPTTVAEAPKSVHDSFSRLVDSIQPRLTHVLDSLGFHAGWEEHGDTLPSHQVHRDVSHVDEQSARAGLYEASIAMSVHRHRNGPADYPEPLNLFFDFATISDTARWALLTDDGFLFSYNDHKAETKNQLPFELQSAIRELFRPHLEVRVWWAYENARLKADSSSATSND